MLISVNSQLNLQACVWMVHFKAGEGIGDTSNHKLCYIVDVLAAGVINCLSNHQKEGSERIVRLLAGDDVFVLEVVVEEMRGELEVKRVESRVRKVESQVRSVKLDP